MQFSPSSGINTPVSVAQGGTGDTSLTAYSVLCGGTSSTGAVQSVASVGTSGQVLTSNGPAVLPTFQNAGGGGYVTNASVYLNSSITTFASASIVLFDTTDFITAGLSYSAVSGKITVTTAGVYELTSYIEMTFATSSSTTLTHTLQVGRSGSGATPYLNRDPNIGQTFTIGTPVFNWGGSTLLNVAAGETIWVIASYGGSNITTHTMIGDQNATFMQITRVG